MEGRQNARAGEAGNRIFPRKNPLAVASSGTITTCKKPGQTPLISVKDSCAWSRGGVAARALTVFAFRRGCFRISVRGIRATGCRFTADFLWGVPFPPPLYSGPALPQMHFALPSSTFKAPLLMSEYGAALEKNGGGNGRSPRKPADQWIVWHDSHMRISGVTRPGIELGSPWWEVTVAPLAPRVSDVKCRRSLHGAPVPFAFVAEAYLRATLVPRPQYSPAEHAQTHQEPADPSLGLTGTSERHWSAGRVPALQRQPLTNDWRLYWQFVTVRLVARTTSDRFTRPCRAAFQTKPDSHAQKRGNDRGYNDMHIICTIAVAATHKDLNWRAVSSSLQSSSLRRGLPPGITVFAPMGMPETAIERVLNFYYTHGAATDKMAVTERGVNEEIWTALYIEVLRADEGSSVVIRGQRKREIPEKTRRPTASSGTMSTYEHPAGSGGAVAGARASHHGDPRLIPGGPAPGFSHVGIVLDDAACRRAFLGYLRLPHPCTPASRSILGSHFMSCSGTTGTHGSQMESPYEFCRGADPQTSLYEAMQAASVVKLITLGGWRRRVRASVSSRCCWGRPGRAAWNTSQIGMTRAIIAEISYEIAYHINPHRRPVNGDNVADIGQCSPCGGVFCRRAIGPRRLSSWKLRVLRWKAECEKKEGEGLEYSGGMPRGPQYLTRREQFVCEYKALHFTLRKWMRFGRGSRPRCFATASEQDSTFIEVDRTPSPRLRVCGGRGPCQASCLRLSVTPGKWPGRAEPSFPRQMLVFHDVSGDTARPPLPQSRLLRQKHF
ncbi:hypothetical protein PR048_006236 [Dryococelus australis]|uniref:Uncharacterized protein n=1 Tax=Dryococelus australis TaxID=614101 RepID=A0ABQ9IAF5_9NEOP|nr:hypothetical protein PR048_006236 [Dryococelus australis]